MTLPRLKALLRARSRRRRKELQELALVVATAFHDPENLQKLFKPTLSETLHAAEKNPEAWETDKWWEATN